MLRNPDLKRLEKIGSGNGTYQPDINLQRRNPLCQKRIHPIPCWFCENIVRSSIGHKKYWNTVNKLHGHCSFTHWDLDFKPYLMKLVFDISHGRL